MGLFNNFPYTNFHELNADWVLRQIKNLRDYVEKYTAMNNVSYAGIWDISKNYPVWSIVTHNNDSYLSIAPTPSGVEISNESYWEKISIGDPRIDKIEDDIGEIVGNMGEITGEIAKNTEILNNFIEESAPALNSVVSRNVKDFGASGSYKHYTVELVNGVSKKFDNDFKAGDGVLVKADPPVVTRIAKSENGIIELAENLSGVYELFHDDTEAIQSALNYMGNKTAIRRVLYFPAGIYNVSSTLRYTRQVRSPLIIMGDGQENISNVGDLVGSVICGAIFNTSGYSTIIPIFDLTGSHIVEFSNIAIVSHPSQFGELQGVENCGMLFAKASDGFGSEHCRLHKVTVSIHSMRGANVTTHGPLGSVGIYNAGAEFFTIQSGVVMADTPLVFTGSNICEATSPGSPAPMNPQTMSQVQIFDTGLANMAGCGIEDGSCCMILEYAHQFNVSCYFSNFSNRSGYSVMTINHCWNNQIFANVEDYSANNDFGVLAKLDTNFLTATDLFFNCPGSAVSPLIKIKGDADNITAKCSTYLAPAGQKMFNNDCTIRNSLIYTNRNQYCGTKNIVNSMIVGNKNEYSMRSDAGTLQNGKCEYGSVGTISATVTIASEKAAYTTVIVIDDFTMVGSEYCEMVGLNGTVIPCTLSSTGIVAEKIVPPGTYRITALFTL